MSTEVQNEKKIESRKVTLVCVAISLSFCIIILTLLLAIVLKKDENISQKENRSLQGRPKASLVSVFDGSFMEKFEAWLSDQFPFRESVVSFKAHIDRAIGKKENNGVYFGKQDFLFQKTSEFEIKTAEEKAKQLNAFAKKYSKMKTAVLISPNSSEILPEFLPKNAPVSNQTVQLKQLKSFFSKQIIWVDCAAAYNGCDDKTKLFYRTDHHWTTEGAFAAFKALMKAWGVAVKDSDFEFHTVSTDFQGSLASKAAFCKVKDAISVCAPKSDKLQLVLEIDGEKNKKASLFFKEKLEGSGQYEVFMGGNYGKATVTTNVETERTLLIFKDSYANCMIPMLAPYFSKIVIIDPRFYSGDINVEMNENGFTHCALVGNVNTQAEIWNG